MKKLPDQLVFLQNRKAVQKTTNESMSGKLSVISGSTSGVGYVALKRLAMAGSNIVMVCRNETKAIEIKKDIESKYDISVDYFIADFSDLDQVRNAATKIIEKYKKIDVLINSAGLHSTKKYYNKDGYELVFTVNHLATYLFTKLLIPTLIASAPSRIIQVNSEGHRFNGLKIDDLGFKKRLYTGLKSYGQSKTAQLFTVWQLAKELESTKVTINAMHPGGVRTNIGNNNGKLYRWFLHHVTWHFLKDPSISGEALYYLAASKDLVNVTGKFFNLTIEELPAKHALNQDNQAKIIEISNKMTGLD
ncbi:MAG: short-chain dehydrogenase [Tenericutes bacterium HGW-Tenericutes-1]|jgi:NAD(P)-dependent dehydrogenase (short-subunit alcohol dehydrogenase family)|nr:MAG: short-chain dehydrogenase [Tenericutes bacterium HGW-Tenericutes-1]